MVSSLWVRKIRKRFAEDRVVLHYLTRVKIPQPFWKISVRPAIRRVNAAVSYR